MEFAGFIVGIIGLALGVAQYFASRRARITLINWGSTIIRDRRAEARGYADTADRVARADREQWRTMQEQIVAQLRRTADDADRSADQIRSFINTVAGPRAIDEPVQTHDGPSPTSDPGPRL